MFGESERLAGLDASERRLRRSSCLPRSHLMPRYAHSREHAQIDDPILAAHAPVATDCELVHVIDFHQRDSIAASNMRRVRARRDGD